MTRDELVTAMARAIGRCRERDGTPLYKSLPESKLNETAQAALRAITEAGCAVAGVSWLEELVGDQVYSAYATGIERDGRWMDAAMKDAAMKDTEMLRSDLGLPDGWNDAEAIKDRLPGLIASKITASRIDTETGG